MKPEPGTVTCLPGGSPLKRSQVCEGRLYTEALVLSVAVFPGPKSTCQASLAWHIQQPETKRVLPEHSCLHFIPRDCLHRSLVLQHQ